MTSKVSKESKFRRWLIKIRDFYIQSLMICDGRIGTGSVMGCPTGQVSSLPRSFSVNSAKSNNDDDLRELIRAASIRSLGNKVELDLLKRQQPWQPTVAIGPNNVPRSFSVGIGRIDEDEPCEFGDDVKVKMDLYPRSRSYAVSRRTGVF